MAGVACYGNRVTPAKGGSSLVLYKKRYSLLRMDQTNVICWVECRLVYNLWYHLALHKIVLFDILLHCIVWGCMELHGNIQFLLCMPYGIMYCLS